MVSSLAFFFFAHPKPEHSTHSFSTTPLTRTHTLHPLLAAKCLSRPIDLHKSPTAAAWPPRRPRYHIGAKPRNEELRHLAARSLRRDAFHRGAFAWRRKSAPAGERAEMWAAPALSRRLVLAPDRSRGNRTLKRWRLSVNGLLCTV